MSEEKQENIADAMSQAKALADEKQIKELAAISPDKLIGCPILLSPMTYARKVIYAKVMSYLMNSKIYEADDYSCLLVSVFVLAEKDPLKLMKMSRDPKAMYEKAVKFADKPDIQYDEMMEEAQQMLTALDAAESLISDRPGEKEESEIEKK